MKPKLEIMVKTGTYTDREGQEKARWTKIGAVFENNGGMFGSLDLIPVNWDGRFSLFEPRDRDASASHSAAPSAPQRPRGGQRYERDDANEIPF